MELKFYKVTVACSMNVVTAAENVDEAMKIVQSHINDIDLEGSSILDFPEVVGYEVGEYGFEDVCYDEDEIMTAKGYVDIDDIEETYAQILFEKQEALLNSMGQQELPLMESGYAN